jgi:hypothetical protein
MIEDFFALHLFIASARKACLAILLAINMSSTKTVRSWERSSFSRGQSVLFGIANECSYDMVSLFKTYFKAASADKSPLFATQLLNSMMTHCS